MTKPIDRNALLDLMESSPHLSVNQLALRFNCGPHTIRKIARLYDQPLARPVAGRRHGRSPPGNPLVAQFLAIHDSFSNTDRAICSEAGVSTSAISALRTGRIKKSSLPTLQALLRVYGYQLTIERIKE